ncbi:LCP family protein [Clostridium paraputrificum]|uniref:LCP family protein n=1 Tax=Clostridium TaxID=1485 RepID=UPI003D342F2A
MKKEKQKWSVKKKVVVTLVSILTVILLGACGAATYGYYMFSKMDNVDINREEVLNESGKKDEYNHITNIGLFGVDRGGDEGTSGLSDSNMILTINKNTKEIKLSSIMRDTYLTLPGVGDNRINEAMIIGGPELMLKTINHNFDLDIDKFITVNLNSLPKIIDKIGGLDIEVDSDEFKWINSYINDINNKNRTNEPPVKGPGKQHLNGTQATAYCRIRYTEGTDFKRTERQRHVFSLIFSKLSNMSTGELYNFVNEVLPLVTTNLSYGEVTSIGTDILGIGKVEIQQNRFPNDGDHWSTNDVPGDYRLNINKEVTTEKMHKFIYSE